MRQLSVERMGKFHIIGSAPLQSSTANAVFVDSNFIISTTNLTRAVEPKAISSLELEQLRETWLRIGNKKVISEFSVCELSWLVKGNQQSNQYEIGKLQIERFRKIDNRFQKISSLKSNFRDKLFDINATPASRLAIIEEHSLPIRQVDSEVIKDLDQIIYQNWAVVLLLMKAWQGLETASGIEVRISKWNAFQEELVNLGIGRTAETMFLATFVFFGGSVKKIGSQTDVTVEDVLKVSSWQTEGVLRTARNVAFDLVFLQWMRKAITGTLFSEPVDTALVTGDRALVAFANQLNFDPHSPESNSYLTPADSLIRISTDCDPSFSLRGPAIRQSAQLISSHELRRLLVPLAKRIVSMH